MSEQRIREIVHCYVHVQGPFVVNEERNCDPGVQGFLVLEWYKASEVSLLK